MNFDQTRNLSKGTKLVIGPVRDFDGVPQHHFKEGAIVTIMDSYGYVESEGEQLNVYYCVGIYPDGEYGMVQMLDNNDIASIHEA